MTAASSPTHVPPPLQPTSPTATAWDFSGGLPTKPAAHNTKSQPSSASAAAWEETVGCTHRGGTQGQDARAWCLGVEKERRGRKTLHLNRRGGSSAMRTSSPQEHTHNRHPGRPKETKNSARRTHTSCYIVFLVGGMACFLVGPGGFVQSTPLTREGLGPCCERRLWRASHKSDRPFHATE